MSGGPLRRIELKHQHLQIRQLFGVRRQKSTSGFLIIGVGEIEEKLRNKDTDIAVEGTLGTIFLQITVCYPGS